MIIYGTRPVSLVEKKLPQVTCQNCNTQGSIVVGVRRTHTHVFWIPMFPLMKKGVSVCTNCEETLKPSKMPEKLKLAYENVKEEAKGPIWQFSGLVLIILLVAFFKYKSKIDDAQDLAFIQAPQVGDVYDYKTSDKMYSTMKIQSVTNDSIRLFLNDYEVNKITGMYKVDKPENYSNITVAYSKEEIKALFDEGEIFNVKRQED